MPLQRGFALIALLALAALISAFLIASTLNLTSAGNSKEREDRSMSALRQAKAALIAYAANEQWQNTGGATPFQPGALPCPDRDNDGIAEDHEVPQKPCNTPLKRIGRFPWKTIGADDLRDASGESLWYAVSAGFLKNTPLYTNIINSDTPGQLTVNGSAPASNVVAIVFAPGETIQGQVRSPANLNDPASYLEQFDNLTYATFTSTALPSAVNDDRLLVITQADLMATVEPIVAANIERDIKPLVQDYFNKWGAYPFPVSFGPGGPPPAQSSYLGDSTQNHGLPPLTDTPTSFTWTGAAVTQLVGHPLQTGSPVVTSSTCTINSSPWQAVCQVNYDLGNNDRPVIVLEIFLSNANILFADTPSGTPAPDDTTKVTMVNRDGNSLASQTGYGQWSFVAPNFPPTRTFVARAAGGALTYTGRLQPAGATDNRVTITVQLPPPAVLNYLPIISGNPGTNPSGAWFILNQWYKQTYYAVSPGYAPGGVAVGSPATCSTSGTPRCLTVGNLPAPTNNKQVILVLAGRALNGNARPSGIANYLEGANLTAANDTTPFVYEHRAGLAGLSCAQFLAGTCPGPNTPYLTNDRVVVVSP